MMLDEREAFLEAIESDPYDLSLRKVFADWLDIIAPTRTFTH
jgi:hypothetical protein